MLRRLHQAEGIGDLGKRKTPMRERPDLAGGERSGNFAEQPFGKLGPTHRQLVHVDRKIGNVPAQWPRVKPAIFIKIALAELDKTTERLQQLEACFHGLAVQRIEHDIDPGAARRLAYRRDKAKLARVADMIGTDETQEGAFRRRSGGCDHRRAATLGDLDRGEPDPA